MSCRPEQSHHKILGDHHIIRGQVHRSALARTYRTGRSRTAAAGAGAGADAAVSGAQKQMAQLLPPSAAEDASPWTTVSYGGRGIDRAQRLPKRPASRPASALASPVSLAQVGPT